MNATFTKSALDKTHVGLASSNSSLPGRYGHLVLSLVEPLSAFLLEGDGLLDHSICEAASAILFFTYRKTNGTRRNALNSLISCFRVVMIGEGLMKFGGWVPAKRH